MAIRKMHNCISGWMCQPAMSLNNGGGGVQLCLSKLPEGPLTWKFRWANKVVYAGLQCPIYAFMYLFIYFHLLPTFPASRLRVGHNNKPIQCNKTALKYIRLGIILLPVWMAPAVGNSHGSLLRWRGAWTEEGMSTTLIKSLVEELCFAGPAKLWKVPQGPNF